MLLADTNWLGLATLDWVVLLGYFVLIFCIGLWSLRRVHDTSDFFMGGRRFGKIFMMFFAFGAGTSSEHAVPVVAGSYRVGLAGIWWQFLWLWATPFYWIIAPVMRRMRALTTADFFQARYSSSTALLYSIYGIIMSIAFIAGGLFSSGKMVDELTGGELGRVAQVWNYEVPKLSWNEADVRIETSWRQIEGYEYAILAMTVLFVTYGMIGGLGAAIITDFIQGVLTIIFSFLLLPYVFSNIGGFGELHNQAGVKSNMLELFVGNEAAQKIAVTLNQEPITLLYIFMLSVTALAGIVVQPHIMGVCGAGKTETEGRVGFTFGNFMKRFCTLAWTFIGLACIVWYLGNNSPLNHANKPATDSAEFQQLSAIEQQKITEERKLHETLNLANNPEKLEALEESDRKAVQTTEKEFADRLFGKAARDILPTIASGLIGLFLAALLAAVMSSGDAQMVVSSGLFTENIYRKYLGKNKSQRHYLWVGRISGLIIVLLALVLQATFTDVIHALKIIIKTPAAIGISLWIGIVWRGWTPAAVWISSICGALAWAGVAYFPNQLHAWGLAESMFKATGKGYAMYDVWQMIAYLSAALLSGFVASLLTKRVREDKLDDFFRLIHTPIRPGEEVKEPCTLPDNPLPPAEKLFNVKDIEISKPTWIGMGGFLAAWICVGLIIWLTSLLARML